MQKLHVRLSCEVKVPDKLFRKIVENAISSNGNVLDTEVAWLKDFIDFSTAKPVFDGWDEGGYIPDSWLVYDAIESKLYELDEKYRLRRRKHSTI